MDIKIKMDDLAGVLPATDISKDLLTTACVEAYTLTPSNTDSYVKIAMGKIYADLTYQTGVDVSNISRIGDLVDEDKLLKALIRAHQIITTALLNAFNGIANTARFARYDYGIAIFDVE